MMSALRKWTTEPMTVMPMRKGWMLCSGKRRAQSTAMKHTRRMPLHVGQEAG